MPSRKHNQKKGKTRRAKGSTVCEGSSGGMTKKDAAGHLQQRQQLERPLERKEQVQGKPEKEELDQEKMTECWICLCEELDECGKLPERDCSCRGQSGFAHASCIIEYAKSKSKEAGEYDVHEFVDPWRICPNCKQRYQHELAIDLVDSCLSFIDETHPEKRAQDQSRMVQALRFKLQTNVEMDCEGKPKAREEGRKTAHQILTAIKHTQIYESQVTKHKLSAYEGLAFFALMDGGEQGAKEAIQYYEKKRECYESVGDLMGMKNVEIEIGDIRAKYFGDNQEYEKLTKIQYQYELKGLRDQYEKSCQEVGDVNARVGFGKCLAQTLLDLHHHIEGERLLEELVTFIRRVHGPENSQTKEMESVLTRWKLREVALIGEGSVYQALRYEDGGDKIVVQGPILSPWNIHRNIDEETTFTVSNDQIFVALGTPVICHGLKNATHLNGKLADLRLYHKDRDRYEINFEDKSLKPAFVRTEHFRIAFDLPDAE